MSRLWAPVFAAAFAAYAWACPPSLSAYRDSGEMASGLWTLSVLHPTSYPLYSLLGRLAAGVPLGDPAHRLALFSAFCAALAVAGVFELCRRRLGAAAAAGAALLLFFNPVFWSVAIVQEMYALWILLAAALFACALWVRERPDERRACAFLFLLGLALTDRLDLLLWAPGLLWLAFSERKARPAPAWAGLALLATPAAMLAFSSNAPMAVLVAATLIWLGGARPRALLLGALGFAVYLYLPVRSAGGPWLDWNHPADLSNFVDSLLRTRYGGTLDLLSKNYAKGELFGDNMVLYGKHLWRAFSVVGLAAAVFGAWTAWRRDPRRALGLSGAYLFSGPIFLLLANMPPNPHAAAVVEPHYLLSDLALVLFAAEGLAALPAPAVWPAAGALAAVPLALGVPGSASRRANFEAPDFARSAMVSAPESATIVARKDVPLYSLWYAQTVRGKRKDLKLVSQGLAGSRWYGGTSLKDDRGWALLYKPFATPDCEVPAAVLAAMRPRGLLMGAEPADPWELVARREDYGYEDAPDFFLADLAAEYAQGLYRLARPDALFAAWALQWEFPEPAAHLAYLAFQAENWAEAGRLYGVASGLSEKLIVLADRYRALPAAREGVRRQSAELLMHRGVVAERLGDRAAARGYYEASIARYPLAQAHFDYAVLFWGKDWPKAVSELEEALRLDPGHPQAAKFLPIARSKARTGG